MNLYSVVDYVRVSQPGWLVVAISGDSARRYVSIHMQVSIDNLVATYVCGRIHISTEKG